MTVGWIELDSAFSARNVDSDAVAWIHMQTGETRYIFPFGDSDEPPPDGDKDWRLLPDKRELGLGQRLVFLFIESYAIGLYDKVQRCFEKRGAWQRFKNILHDQGLLDQWHKYEEDKTRQALLAWAAKEGIDVNEDVSGPN